MTDKHHYSNDPRPAGSRTAGAPERAGVPVAATTPATPVVPSAASTPAVSGKDYTIAGGLLRNIGQHSLLVIVGETGTLVAPEASVPVSTPPDSVSVQPDRMVRGGAHHLLSSPDRAAEFGTVRVDELPATAGGTANHYVASDSDARTANNTPGDDPFRLNYRVLGDTEKQQMRAYKEAAAGMLALLRTFGSKPEYTLAQRKLQESVFWAVSGLTE